MACSIASKLVFQGPNEGQKAYGVTHSGKFCRFDFKLGTKFDKGAGVAPTHGGFLMCGKRGGNFAVSKRLFLCPILKHSL